jgi:hypothetical protein
MSNLSRRRCPCLLTDQDKISNLQRGPSTDSYYQVLVHLAKWFQRRRFFTNWQTRHRNCLWRPCLLTDQVEMSNLNWGPTVDASYLVSVRMTKRFQRRRFLEIDQSETKFFIAVLHLTVKIKSSIITLFNISNYVLLIPQSKCDIIYR